jgi:alpha-L-fucosidase 2
MDKAFLQQKAFPYMNEVCKFLDDVVVFNDSNKRKPLLSSTPEYNDNSIKAWFTDWTNYDLALVKNAFQMMWTACLQQEKENEAKYWLRQGSTLPGFFWNETGLTIAVNQNLEYSHRHQNHLHAIHPLGLLNMEDSVQKIMIENSLRQIEKLGTRKWVGYSFAWIGSVYARAKNGDSAAINLKRFATNFVSPNSFHLNGDQKKGQYSDFTYRPFTLEGNFAYAQGIHEMLLQSHKEFIEVFPAIPNEWKNVSFKTLRAEGAFLISAKKENGVPVEVKIRAEAGGLLRIKLPFKTWITAGMASDKIVVEKGVADVKMSKGQTITFKNAYE